MTLVDSCDSILMLYSYSGFPEHSFAIFENSLISDAERDVTAGVLAGDSQGGSAAAAVIEPQASRIKTPSLHSVQEGTQRVHCLRSSSSKQPPPHMRVKRNMISGLSIILTLMSILIAFR